MSRYLFQKLAAMRYIICFLTILILGCLFFPVQGESQSLASNHCDSSVMTQQEYQRCKGDSIFNTDIIVWTNYIIFLKTELLPKYRQRRKELTLPDTLKLDITRLKVIYDSTTNYKFQRMALDMDKNQRYVQPKAYITSLLTFETFKFYPDSHAVLLNEIHLMLNPRTDVNQMMQIQKLVDKIYSSLTNSLKGKIQSTTSELLKEKKAYDKNHRFALFQGSISDEEREKYNIINFLLWTA